MYIVINTWSSEGCSQDWWGFGGRVGGGMAGMVGGGMAWKAQGTDLKVMVGSSWWGIGMDPYSLQRNLTENHGVSGGK